MKNHKDWQINYNDEGPLVATAIHNGHLLRDEIEELTALSDVERLREEDPFTGDWTTIANVQIVMQNSRFEVDLNRPRDKAVYIDPEDAWGLKLWKWMVQAVALLMEYFDLSIMLCGIL